MIDKINYLPGLGKSDHVVVDFNFNCFIGKKTHKRSTPLTRETTSHVQIS